MAHPTWQAQKSSERSGQYSALVEVVYQVPVAAGRMVEAEGRMNIVGMGEVDVMRERDSAWWPYPTGQVALDRTGHPRGSASD